MLQQDYLMRMILQLIEAIMKSLETARGDAADPQASADLLEAAIGTATDIDGGVLLSLEPESVVNILQVSGTDPRVVEYVGRSLFLESSYLDEASKSELAALRAAQAQALAHAYGFDLDANVGAEAAMDAFLESEREKLPQV
jgi:hypothetical protein